MSDLLESLRSALSGRYRIDREIGRGGMAVVFRAQDTRYGRTVAIKVLRPEISSAVGAERFAREIAITASLEHPHILHLIEAGDALGHPYYVTPYVDGESLADQLRRETQLPIDGAVGIAVEVADALAFAHDRGVIHRDIKPANILLSGGHAVVSDFGVARAVDAAGGETLTSTGVAIGTPHYMSPEQGTAGGHVDHRTDIYSLGCVLYEMLAGEPPFTGPSAQAIIARHSAEPVRHVRVVRGTVPVELEAVVEKALAKVPADRFSDARQFKEALQHPETTGIRIVRSSRRKRLPRILGIAAAAVLAGVAVWRVGLPTSPSLDANRVVVFPLVAAGAGGGSVGEDVSTIIGNALDGVGPLRWIDGWAYLEQRYRDEPRSLPLRVARDIAGRHRAAFFVLGRVVSQSDSSGVYLELHDVEGDTSAARASAFDAGGETWRAGLRAVNGLLPTLIPTGAPSVPEEWFDRNPAAMASFLLGEEQFRRAQFETSLEHYQAAVAADSQFALAAIRGAQAAGWNHHAAAAQSLIAVALAHADQLDPALTAFARGYAAYMAGRAGEAVGRLREAVTYDPDLAVAWWQLGDTYVHLLPVGGRPDSLAEAALDEAYRLDPSAVYVLFHLLEIAIRQGERERTDRLLREFAAAGPDSTMLRQVEIMRTCAFRGVGAPDWERLARETPLELLSAGKSLAAGGAQLPCAARAFGAVLAGDTASGVPGVGRRWSALQGMQHLLVVWGREAELIDLLDSAVANGMPDAQGLYLLDAAIGANVAEQARAVARADREVNGADYRGTRSANRLWALALWEASEGNVAAVAGIADELDARATRSGDRREQLTADAVAAHLALARGDSVEALRRFRALHPNAPPDDLVWPMVEPLAVERLKLAELLLAQGETREALDVVRTFDAPQPLIHLLCLTKRLELGLEAARRLGDRDLERRLSVRQAMVAAAGAERR